MIRAYLERRRFMREHRWTAERLSDYLDQELGAAERARVDEHVGMCPQCRRVLATLRRTIAGLRSLGGSDRPEVADRVIDRLRSEH